MAHRKLQQEIDRVFKKINEGLEIFDMYYERHENCVNNPSQKDKLESDLKREVKKLQRLREQIKSWQSSPDIKDKDSLLDHRRSVEIAMEKYKAVEKASKEKAYSNISLKKSEHLDPHEQERRNVSEYLSSMIEELERQYEAAQVEVDRLILLNKKKKTASQANTDKKEQLKAMQARYRWHQQQMELALRLLANEELDPQDVKDVKDDINYFVESNQDPDFVEDETIYEALNLQSNETIAHEVAQYFASQMSDDGNDEDSGDLKDSSKLSKKEQRKLEREAKKAAKAATKGTKIDTAESETPSAPPTAPTPTVPEKLELRNNSLSSSPSPALESVDSSKSISTSISIPNTPKGTTNLPLAKPPTATSLASTLSHSQTPETPGHTHIHQSQYGVTTSSTLKPATVPIRPAGELRWAVAASQGVEKEKKFGSASNLTSGATLAKLPSNPTSRNASASTTPAATAATLAQHLERTNSSLLTTGPSTNKVNVVTSPLANTDDAGSPQGNNKRSGSIASKEQKEPISLDIYESDVTDDELDGIDSQPQPLSNEDIGTRTKTATNLRDMLCKDLETLLLPSGIQAFIIGMELYQNNLSPTDGKLGGYRRSRDVCTIPRLDPVPLGVNPPSPLDAFRSTQQWDLSRCNLRQIIESNEPYENKFKSVLDNFRSLEMFTLFYNYYFAITPLEKEVAAIILKERSWKVSRNETMWFLKQSETKFSNEQCEVADFKIFKLDDWSVIDKLNFQLDYASLKDQPKKEELLLQQQQQQQPDSLSRGQQLLQQLNQGKATLTT